MTLKTHVETYEIYEGKSAQEVAEKHEDNQKYWRFNLLSSKKSKQFRINPFEDSCIGVYMSKTTPAFHYKMFMTQNSKDNNLFITHLTLFYIKVKFLLFL